MRLAQHPGFLTEVWEARREWCEQDGTTGSLADIWDRCIAFEGERGGIVFIPQGFGTYEAHVAFLPGARFVDPMGAGALNVMFTALRCERIVARIAADNRAAIRLAKRMGFNHTHDDGQFVRRGEPHAIQHFSLSREAWQAMEGR